MEVSGLAGRTGKPGVLPSTGSQSQTRLGDRTNQTPAAQLAKSLQLDPMDCSLPGSSGIPWDSSP